MTLIQRCGDGSLDAARFAFQLKRMAEQQGGGKNGTEGIRDSPPGNVGRGAVDRLVYPDRAADASRGEQA